MTTPKSIAPRLIKLAVTSNMRMPTNAESSDNGTTNATNTAARKCPRERNRTAITSAPPSSKLRLTVSIVPSITSDWS